MPVVKDKAYRAKREHRVKTTLFKWSEAVPQDKTWTLVVMFRHWRKHKFKHSSKINSRARTKDIPMWAALIIKDTKSPIHSLTLLTSLLPKFLLSSPNSKHLTFLRRWDLKISFRGISHRTYCSVVLPRLPLITEREMKLSLRIWSTQSDQVSWESLYVKASATASLLPVWMRIRFSITRLNLCANQLNQTL